MAPFDRLFTKQKELQSHDNHTVTISEIHSTNVLNQYLGGNPKYIYKSILKELDRTVSDCIGDAQPRLTMPYISDTNYPSFVNVVVLDGDPTSDDFDGSHLAVVWLSDDLEDGVVSKVSDWIGNLSWVDMSEDYLI